MKDGMSTPSRRDAAAARRGAAKGPGRGWRAILATLSLSLCLPLSPAASPQETQTVSQPLQYEVSVILKLIQVYVTDKAGNPVRDLTKDEFAVLDNGRAMTVTEFERHELPAPGADTVTKDAAPASPAPPAPATINRKFILFFDFAFNNQKGAGASLKAALHFLDNEVRPSDEIAVLSYSTLRGLRVHEFLTSNHAKAREAVAALTAKEISGRAAEVESDFWAFTEASGYSTQPSGKANEQANQQSAARMESKLQAQNYIDRLTALAQGLRLVPGQKNVLFFSTGVPYTLIHANANPGGSGDTVLQPLYETMLKEFSASNCSFYAFDTRESAQVTSLFAFDERGPGGYFTAGAVGSTATNPFRDDKLTGMDTLKKLSSTTGGQYFSNIGFYEKNLAQVQAATGAYYVLGYSLAAAPDGRFHEVKVEVKRKGCQVRAQRGYFDPKPFKEFTPLEKELQLFDLALNDRTSFSLPKTFPAAALFTDAGEGARLMTVCRIPGEAREGFDGKNVEFVALVFDDKENVVSLQRTATDLSRYRGRDIIFSSGLAAKPGTYKCRLVIRDLDTGGSAVGSTTAFVPDPSSGFVLFSPLLLVAGGPYVNLDGAVKGTSEPRAWREIYPYDATKFRPVIGDEAVGAGKLVAIVPYKVPEANRAQVSFSAHLVDSATGKSRPAVYEPLARLRHGNVEVLVLEFALNDVPPGRYVLFINGSDKTSRGLASAHVPLTVAR